MTTKIMPTFDEMKRNYVATLIVEFEGHIFRMVEASGMSRASVYRSIKDYGLERDLTLARLTRKNRHKAQFEKEMQ